MYYNTSLLLLAPNFSPHPTQTLTEYFSNWTRFLNHADAPNCNVKSLPMGMSGKPRVWFVASRDISPGEEICFSYGDDYWIDDAEPVE